MPKVNLRLKNMNKTKIKSVKMIDLLYLQGFTAGYTIKETKNFLSKKNDRAIPPNPNSSHIIHIGFEYVMPSPV